MNSRFVIMGVCGCGKSLIGAALANALGGIFIDGDDLHPEANRAKMVAGQPLTDADRAPWLVDVGRALGEGDGPTVIGCSALKRRYREVIRNETRKPVLFVYLKGSRQTLATRLAARTGHFMPLSLLDSQIATLEPPDADEMVLTIDIEKTPEQILSAVLRGIKSDLR